MLHVQGFLPLQTFAPGYLMREDIKDPRKLATKADKIRQSASNQSVNGLLLQFQFQKPQRSTSTTSSPILLPVLLLVLLHALPILLLRPPLRTQTIAGPNATVGIRLSVAVPPAPGFRETS